MPLAPKVLGVDVITAYPTKSAAPLVLRAVNILTDLARREKAPVTT